MLGLLAVQAQGPTAEQDKCLSITQCYKAAQQNFPLVKQYELIGKSRDYTVSNAMRSYLPQVNLSAKASWQSDVTRLSIDEDKLAASSYGSFINVDELNDLFPSVSKDQYGVSLDIVQTIWDGGASKAQSDMAGSEAEASAKSIDADIYGLRAKINDLYFGIILLQNGLELNDLMLGSLEANYDKVKAYCDNGIAGQADLDALRIRILQTKQEALNMQNSKRAYCKMLALLTGLDIDESYTLLKPEELSFDNNAQLNRPELAMYDAQIQQVYSQNRLLDASITPKFGLYVSGGYGRPGLNMLEDSFQPYVVAGIKLSWNIGNFYNLGNNRRLLQTKVAGIESAKEVFKLNADMDISRHNSELESLRGQMAYDDEIIALRHSVLKANEKKMAEGTISGSDLVGYMNEALAAEQSKAQHEVQLLLAMYNLQFARGENQSTTNDF